MTQFLSGMGLFPFDPGLLFINLLIIIAITIISLSIIFTAGTILLWVCPFLSAIHRKEISKRRKRYYRWRRQRTKHYFLRRKEGRRPYFNKHETRRFIYALHKQLEQVDIKVKNLRGHKIYYCVAKPFHGFQNYPSKDEVYKDHEHQYLHDSSIQYGLKYGVDLTAAVHSMDPLHQFRMIRQLSNPNCFSSKMEVYQTKLDAKMALVAAANLQREKVDPDTTITPSVYISRDEDELPIVIGTRASISCTPTLGDFKGLFRPSKLKSLKGLDNEIKVMGEGDVQWVIKDVYGNVKTLSTVAYYVPTAQVRLFSPQKYFREKEAGELHLNHKRIKLTLK